MRGVKRRHTLPPPAPVESTAWPASVTMTGPGGHSGSDKLRSLVGDPTSIDAIFCSTMGLDAMWLLRSIGLGPRVDELNNKRGAPSQDACPRVVMACHHPGRCWRGIAKERRQDAAVPGYGNSVSLLFPPFTDAPDRISAGGYRHVDHAPQGLLGCMHGKFLLVFRETSLRVIVSTANFTRRQWDDTRNHLWSQTFPAAPAAAAAAMGARARLDRLLSRPGAANGFGQELASFVANLMAKCEPTNQEAALCTRLASYDYADAQVVYI